MQVFQRLQNLGCLTNTLIVPVCKEEHDTSTCTCNTLINCTTSIFAFTKHLSKDLLSSIAYLELFVHHRLFRLGKSCREQNSYLKHQFIIFTHFSEKFRYKDIKTIPRVKILLSNTPLRTELNSFYLHFNVLRTCKDVIMLLT